MRIQISSDLKKEEIIEKLKNATIVDDGDYILLPKNNKIRVYDFEGITFIDVEDIDYIESANNEIKVYCGDKHYLSMLKLYEYLEESNQLIRINKSTIINKNSIGEIRPSINMKFKVKVRDKWLEVNRTYYFDFKDEIGI